MKEAARDADVSYTTARSISAGAITRPPEEERQQGSANAMYANVSKYRCNRCGNMVVTAPCVSCHVKRGGQESSHANA